jgi:hypothetical protein
VHPCARTAALEPHNSGRWSYIGAEYYHPVFTVEVSLVHLVFVLCVSNFVCCM